MRYYLNTYSTRKCKMFEVSQQDFRKIWDYLETTPHCCSDYYSTTACEFHYIVVKFRMATWMEEFNKYIFSKLLK